MNKYLLYMKSIIKENKAFILGFVLVVVYLFSNCILNNYIVSFTNINYTMEPFNSYRIETDGPLLSDVADSEFPLKYHVFYNKGLNFWDSDIALGTTVNVAAEILYPGNIVYNLPMKIAIGLKVFLEFFVGFVSMYMFMKSIGVKKYSAAISGIIYTFSSVIVVWLGWPHSDVAVLAPLLFFGIEKLMSAIKVKYMLLITIVIYTMLMAGMPTYVAYFMYLAGIYIVIFTCIRYWNKKKNIVVIGTMFAIAVILSVIMSIPYTIELISQVVGNGYASSRANYAELQLETDYLRTFLFPYVREGLSAHINESTMYVGILPIVLFPLYLINNKDKNRNLFFVISSIVVLCLVFTDIFNDIYAKIPAINTSLKYRVIALLMFTMSVLTGLTLNDIIQNGKLYWNRKWIIVIQALICVAVLYISTESIYENNLNSLRMVTFMMLIMLVSVVLLMRRRSKMFQIVLAMIVIFDNVGFAKEYLPYIDADKEVIPVATDSVEYMMNNTNEQERILGIGAWNLFPNTNTYYDLNDIRVHGFVATNQDISEYYKAIYSQAYKTNTRVDFSKIDNYELLKYIGVKYVYSSALGNVVELFGESNNRNVLGILKTNSNIKEEIIISEGIVSLQVLFATYNSIPLGENNLNIRLYNENNEEVFEQVYSTSNIRDNAYLKINLEDANLKSGKYMVELEFGDIENDTITLWYANKEGEQFSYGEQTIYGNLIINAVYPVKEYDIVYQGIDGLEVGCLKDYADKVELIEKVYSFSDEKEILYAMQEKYIDNAMFITVDRNIESYDIPLNQREKVEILQYSDDYIKIKCTTDFERYVSVNDYYSKDWNAYVNGKKVDIEKINYLTRAVKVEPGENIVIEMKYEPEQIYGYLCCFAAGTTIWFVLFIFRNKLQKVIDEKIIKETKK